MDLPEIGFSVGGGSGAPAPTAAPAAMYPPQPAPQPAPLYPPPAPSPALYPPSLPPTQPPQPQQQQQPHPPASLYPSSLYPPAQPQAPQQPTKSQEERQQVETLVERMRRQLDAAHARAAQDSDVIVQLRQQVAAAEQRAQAALQKLARQSQQFETDRSALGSEDVLRRENERLAETVTYLEQQLQLKNKELSDLMEEWTEETERFAAERAGRAVPDDRAEASELAEAKAAVQMLTNRVDDLERTNQVLTEQVDEQARAKAEYHAQVLRLQTALAEGQPDLVDRTEPTGREAPPEDDAPIQDPFPVFPATHAPPSLLYGGGDEPVAANLPAPSPTHDTQPDPDPEPEPAPEPAPAPAPAPASDVRCVDLRGTKGAARKAAKASEAAASEVKDTQRITVSDDVRDAVRAKLAGSSKREQDRMSVPQITELLGQLGLTYSKPKAESLRRLREAVGLSA